MTSSPPSSEYDLLAYADLVLRRLAHECPGAAVDMVRVVEYEARVRLRRPVGLSRTSCFELASPEVLCVPRTRRALELLVMAAAGPLPEVVPFVSAASSRSVTVAAAPASGSTVTAAVAERAMALHWLAPWGRGEIESVATHDTGGCQGSCAGSGVWAPAGGARPDGPAGYLVFAGETDRVDPTAQRWGGARVGVVRSTYIETAVPDDPMSSRRISVGEVEYVLVDQCPL